MKFNLKNRPKELCPDYIEWWFEGFEKELRQKLIELGVKFKDFDYTAFLSYEDDREEIFRKGYGQGQLDLIEEILGEG